MTHPIGGSTRRPGRLSPARRSARMRPRPESLEARLTPTGSIQGSLWNDFNSDGVKGASEPAISGRTVFLDQNQDHVLDNGEVSTTTASDGSYSFANLAAGTYYVAQVVPNGWQQTSPTPATAEKTVSLSGVAPYLFTFNNLASTSDTTIPAYHENGFTFNTSAQQPMQFTIYGSSNSVRYAGAPALSAEWSPSTISLTQDNGASFSANSIDLSTFWNSIYYPTVSFTGTRADGTQIQQSFTLSNQLGFQTGTFSGFTNIVSLTWRSTGTSDYHEFRNVSVTTAAPTDVSGINFGSVDVGLPPTAANDAYSVNEGSSLSQGAPGVLANDTNPTGAPLSIVIDSNPVNGSLSPNTQTGAFTYTPTAYYYGADSFRYHIVANGLSSSIATVSLTVNHVNQPPVVAADSYNVSKNTTLTVGAPGVLANDGDPDGDPFTAVPASGATPHGSYTLNANGSFTYTPNSNYLGLDTFSYRATDGANSSSYAIVNLNVTGTNDAPTAGNDAYSINENATLSVGLPGVLGNDADPNGQPISAYVYTQPAHGTLSLGSGGAFVYTPSANYYGSDSFTYRANDGSLYSNVATVSLTVNQVFSPPTATADSYSTAENTTLTVSAPGILANDSASSGLTLTPYVISTTPNGTLTVNLDGSFTYVPNHNFYGTDSFNYYVTDGQSSSIYVTDTITVTHVNQPPVATNDTYTVAENGSLSAVTGVSLVTMSSQPGDYIGAGKSYTFSPGASTFGGYVMSGGAYTSTVRIIVSGPANEWWSFAFVAPNQGPLVPGVYNNAVRWPFQQGAQPGLDVSGDGRGSNTLTGQFTVLQADYDANGNIVSFDATFEQHSEGQTPALTGHVQYNATGGLPFGVLSNDTDPDNDPLQATLASNPAHGSVDFHSDGSFTYTPSANYSGPDSFTYKANDGAFDSNVATVSLNVAPVNQAPTFTATDPPNVNEGSGPQSFANWAHFNPGPGNGDVGQTATYLVANLSNSSLFSVAPTVSPDGTLSFTPAPNAFGSATFQLAVRDSGGTTNGGNDTSGYQTFQINVAQVAH
ncbi:Ig-like domain-containing protein, partial [Singulisphaera rosea]